MNKAQSKQLIDAGQPSKPGILKRIAGLLPSWGWLVLIAGSLRFINLGQENLWYDETFTAWLSKLDWTNLWKAIQGDVHPPGWYLVEWLNVRIFGSSEIALRLPSAILGILAVILVWKLANEIGFKPRTAFVAGLLAAVLPSSVYYSQDARMYPMLACCVLAALLFAIKNDWLLFALASIGAVYAQNLGVLYILAIGIPLLLFRMASIRKAGHGLKRMLAPVLALSGVVAVWSPWALLGIKDQIAQMTKGFWILPPTLGGILTPLVSMTTGWRIDEHLQVHIAIASICFSLIGLIASRHWLASKKGAFVLAVILGAPLLIALASFVWRSVYLSRAMLPSTLALMLLWAYPLEHLSRPNKIAARAIMVPVLAIALISHYFPSTGSRLRIQDWTDPIAKGFRPGDVVYHIAIDSTIMFGYYLPQEPYRLMPEATDLNQSLTPATKQAMGFTTALFDDLKAEGFNRAWLVSSDNLMTSSAEQAAIAGILASHPYTVVKHEIGAYDTKAIYLVVLT